MIYTGLGIKMKAFGNKLKVLGKKAIELCRSEAGLNIIDFLFSVAAYGLMINFTAYQLFNSCFKLSIFNILAFGIAFYFIKNEIPSIVRKIIK